jgi:hypothetical protein
MRLAEVDVPDRMHAEAGATYVFAVTADDGLSYDSCHSCAVTAFALGQRVACEGTLEYEDPADPTHCNFCGQLIDDSLRRSLDDCAWIDALQDALEDFAQSGLRLHLFRPDPLAGVLIELWDGPALTDTDAQQERPHDEVIDGFGQSQLGVVGAELVRKPCDPIAAI